MKLNVLALIFSLMTAVVAQADGQRVLVVMKDAKAFRSAHVAYQTKGSYALRSFNVAGAPAGFEKIDAQVEDSLGNINTLVISTKNESEIVKLRNNPAVAYVEKEVFHEAPRPVKGWLSAKKKSADMPKVNTPWGIMAVKAPQAWKISSQGQGARVLVLDTGMDTEHPALKANFEKGQDFTGNSSGSDITDDVGHGTHVAGTVAASLDKDGFTGVAPKAKILAGRVCAPNGCSNVAIARGINWGIEEKVDVITMSLGGPWSTPAERIAVSNADKAGITVIAASGNDGSGRVSYPAALSSVIAVGAVDSNLDKAAFSQYGPELAIVAPGVAVVSSVPLGSGREAEVVLGGDSDLGKVKSTTFQGAREVTQPESNSLVHAGLGKADDFAKMNVAGKYALISRGEITFAEKVQHAIKAGAAGVIIYNNAPGLIQGGLTDDGSVLAIPVFMIEQTAGEKVVAQLKQGKTVEATLQTIATDYSAFDGTSMATPHVAGVAALMKAANKSLTGAQVKEILKNTAQKLNGPNTNNELGAGLVDAEAAVQAALRAAN